MKSVEQLAVEIQLQFEKDGEPVTYEEAVEMAQMEIKEKGIKRYERAAEPKAEQDKHRRTVKISEEKINLFNSILTNLDRCEGVSRENIEVLKENKLILVRIGNKNFKIDLIEQRQKK